MTISYGDRSAGKKRNSPSVVSLFSGCGGFDLGFKELGFDLIYACDNDPAAVETYSRNIDDRVFLRDVNSPEFISDLRTIKTCDIVLGGFPCQGFSKAGPKQKNDPRNQLYVRMKDAVEILRPHLFIAENVDGLSQNFGGKFVDQIVSDFQLLGYQIEYRILDAAAYGAPQHRRRIFFVGVHSDFKGTFRWPAATHNALSRNGEFKIAQELPLFNYSDLTRATLLPVRTLRETILDIKELSSKLPDHTVVECWPKKYENIFKSIGERQKLCNVRHSETSVYTWDIPEVFGRVNNRERLVLETISKNRRHKKYGDIPNGNPLSINEIEELAGLSKISNEIGSLLKKGYLKQVQEKYDLKGAMFCSGLFKRPGWDSPAPTILTNFYNPRYFLHPSENRPFSLRECARIQGFPDSFRFTKESVKNEIIDGYRLVGNAVSPIVSRRFAEAALELLTPRFAKERSLRNTNRYEATL